MAVPKIDITGMNKPASQVKKDQEEEVYNKLYPKMTSDFVHIKDMEEWIKKIEADFRAQNDEIRRAFEAVKADLNTLGTAMGTHAHPVAGTTASPTGVVIIPTTTYTGTATTKKIDDVKAKSLIDNSAISGFDGSTEVRKKSTTRLTPPLSADKI